MFNEFFYLLRAYGLKISPTEWMTMHAAMERNLHGSSLSGFYQLGRSIVVHSETDYDRYDQAFMEYFEHAERSDKLEKIMKFVDKPNTDFYSIPGSEERITDQTPEETERLFQERLEEQQYEHNDGRRWIGTNGFTTFGNQGQNMGGIRVGGEGKYRSAYRVASQRKYRDWRKDNTLDSRQFQMAFRSLRQLTDNSITEKTELDIDKTIRKTSDRGGLLQVEMKAPRKNMVKLLMLIDTGGSMDPYQQLLSLLFQSVKKAGSFADLKIYYFHNFIGRYLYKTPEIKWNECVNTEDVLTQIPSNYRVIFVGDGQMSIDELKTDQMWRNDYANPNDKTGLDWFLEFKHKYNHSIWLHPQPAPKTENYFTKSYFILSEHFRMYQLTLDGLNAGVKKLLVNY